MTKRILIIGDACKDIFKYCLCTRLCPEAPVPVLDIHHETSNYGMAGNVARNIEDLGGTCDLICNINADDVTKTRYVELKTNHMFVRIDSPNKIERISPDRLRQIKWGNYAAVVISDYNKGFLNVEDINYISKHHNTTFLDTKKQLESWANCVTFIKINRKEWAESKPLLERSVFKESIEDKIIQTLGDEGCEYQGVNYPVSKVEIKNLSGAGDSFLAGLVVTYLETGSIEKALYFANEVATIVVQKMGVSTIKN